MKKFKFNLEKILELREFQEKEAQIQLGKAIAELNNLKTELEEVGKERLAANAKRMSGASVVDLVTIDNYCLRLDFLKEELIEKIAKAELIVEEKRKIFIEKMRDRKVVTKLKEKQLKQWKDDMLAEDDKTNDDIVTSMFNK